MRLYGVQFHEAAKESQSKHTIDVSVVRKPPFFRYTYIYPCASGMLEWQGGDCMLAIASEVLMRNKGKTNQYRQQPNSML